MEILPEHQTLEEISIAPFQKLKKKKKGWKASMSIKTLGNMRTFLLVSGQESAFQRKGHMFDPWLRN